MTVKELKTVLRDLDDGAVVLVSRAEALDDECCGGDEDTVEYEIASAVHERNYLVLLA